MHAETFEGEDDHNHTETAPLVVADSREFVVGTPAHSHDATEQWAPQDGFERTFYTSLATVLAAAGFALIIGAISVLAGIPISFANGFVWGMAGVVTFSLAPAYGLPPELPDMPTDDLFAR